MNPAGSHGAIAWGAQMCAAGDLCPRLVTCSADVSANKTIPQSVTRMLPNSHKTLLRSVTRVARRIGYFSRGGRVAEVVCSLEKSTHLVTKSRQTNLGNY